MRRSHQLVALSVVLSISIYAVWTTYKARRSQVICEKTLENIAFQIEFWSVTSKSYPRTLKELEKHRKDFNSKDPLSYEAKCPVSKLDYEYQVSADGNSYNVKCLSGHCEGPGYPRFDCFVGLIRSPQDGSTPGDKTPR